MSAVKEKLAEIRAFAERIGCQLIMKEQPFSPGDYIYIITPKNEFCELIIEKGAFDGVAVHVKGKDRNKTTTRSNYYKVLEKLLTEATTKRDLLKDFATLLQERKPTSIREYSECKAELRRGTDGH